MSKPQQDIEAAILTAEDRGESLTLMEPTLVGATSPHRAELNDMVVELTSAAAGFRGSLPGGVRSALASLVRAMNCYYSNLIEGHNTHPVDIERALKEDYSTDPTKRDLQLEARAHVEVQAWIEGGGLAGRAATQSGICEIHERFCKLLPQEHLKVEDPSTKETLATRPGALRTRDVIVGQHVAISPGAVPRFLKRFEEVYGSTGRFEQVLSVGAAHHRLLWIHPFLDGNGRVARLMSHAMLLDALGSGGIWSIARGLARAESDYKRHLAECDQERSSDYDGRGSRSEAALARLSKFFLTICLDQVSFMESLVQPARLRARILTWTDEEIRTGDLPAKAGQVLEAVLYRGELPRGEVPGLLDLSERQARRVVGALLSCEALISSSTKAPLRLNLPAHLASRWMPGLFPDQG